MARRRPSAVRAGLRTHPQRLLDERPIIDGLSRSTLRLIAGWELAHDLWPGWIAESLTAWRRMAALPQRRLDRLNEDGHGCGDPHCCPDPYGVRSRLEHVLQSLPRNARRELATLIAPLDAQLRRRIVPDPSDP